MIAATPVVWFSGDAPVQLLDFEVPARILPHVAGAARVIGTALLDHALRSIARSAGATAFDASWTAVEAGVALHAGMWPALFRPPSRGDLPNTRACGFVRAGHLGTTAPALSAELEAFLAEGNPPVVIALGSNLLAQLRRPRRRRGRSVQRDWAAMRDRTVDRPRDRELPDGTLVVPYATYHLLFPHAAALVIHGGAETAPANP